MNLGFLGTGHITSSLIEGIFKSNLKIKKIYISSRNRVLANKLSKMSINRDDENSANKSLSQLPEII